MIGMFSSSARNTTSRPMTDGAPCSIRNLTRGVPNSTYKWTIQAQGSSLGSLSATQMSDEVRPVANFRKVLPIGGNEDLLEAQLEGDRLEFFRSATGIYDVDELKKHILAVHRAAYEVSPSACPFHGSMTHGLNAGSPVSMSRQVQLRKVRSFYPFFLRPILSIWDAGYDFPGCPHMANYWSLASPGNIPSCSRLDAVVGVSTSLVTLSCSTERYGERSGD